MALGCAPSTQLRGLALCLVVSAAWAGGDSGPGGGTPGTPKAPLRPAAAAPPVVVVRSDDELVLLKIRLGMQALAETLPGYPAGRDDVLLPLGQICRLLEIPVRVDLVRGVAQGVVGNDSEPFLLDLGQRTVSRSGHPESLAKDEAELHEDDIYVSARALSRWIPADFKVDLKGSIALVAPREPLPIQQRWERERTWARLAGAASGQKVPPGVKPLDDPYRLLEVPMMDLYLQASRQPSGGRSSTNLQGALDLAGDFLGLNGRGYLSGDTATHSGFARVTLGRHDPHGELLGPLHAKVAEFGDVQLQGTDLVAPFISGTGVRVDNWPLGTQGLNDKRSFRGTLAPGWTVELYVNGALLAFQASRADGLYEFLDVQLTFGWNDVRIAFYGPGGEKREERHRFDLTQPPVGNGEFRYRFGALRPRGADTDELVTELAYGFGKGFVVGGGYSRVPDFASLEHGYGSAFIQNVGSGLSSKLSLSSEQGGGSAAQVSLFSRIRSLAFSLQHAELFNGFSSPLFNAGFGAVSRRTELGLFGTLPSLNRPIVSLGLNLRRDDLVAGGSRTSILPRLSTTFGRWYFTNLVDWEEQRLPNAGTTRQGSGDFLASRTFKRFTLRGDLVYGLEPARTLQSWGIQADTSRWAPWIFQAGYRETLQTAILQAKERTLQASGSKVSGHFALGLGAGWSSLQGWSATVSFRIGLAREPFTGRWLSQATPTSSFGAVSTRGTLDLDGRPMPTSTPSVRVGHQFRPPAPDMDGVSFMPQLPPDEEVLVQAGPGAEEPMLRSVSPGWTVVPRTGHVARIDAAMEGIGELTGTVYQQKGSRERAPLVGIGLEVVDPSGKVVREFASEYDGFFDLTDLRPGAYALRIAAGSLQARRLADPGPRTFTIPKAGAQIDGFDLVVDAGSVAVVEVEPGEAAPAPEPAAPSIPPPSQPPPAQLPVMPPHPPVHAPEPAAPVEKPAAPLALPDEAEAKPRRAARLEAIRRSDWKLAYAMSFTDLLQKRPPKYIVRAQVAALDPTIQEALALFTGPDLDCFALPMTLPNGQCCPQLIMGTFSSKRAATAFLARLPKALCDAPPRVERVDALLARPMDCSFQAH